VTSVSQAQDEIDYFKDREQKAVDAAEKMRTLGGPRRQIERFGDPASLSDADLDSVFDVVSLGHNWGPWNEAHRGQPRPQGQSQRGASIDANPIARAIRRQDTGSETTALLFETANPDREAGIAEELGLSTVTKAQADAARDAVRAATRAKWGSVQEVTVYRGGPVRGEIVPVTTNRSTAQTHADTVAGRGVVQSWVIPGSAVLADMAVVNGPHAHFQESELLVHRDSLSERTIAAAAAKFGNPSKMAAVARLIRDAARAKRTRESNDCHNPGGSRIGGRFCASPGGAPGSPQHLAAIQRPKAYQPTVVGITSYTPGRSNREVFSEMPDLEARLHAIPTVINVKVVPALGAYKGNTEPSWSVYYEGNGAARKLMARMGKKYGQESVFIFKAGGDQPLHDVVFDRPVGGRFIKAMNRLLGQTGFGGWTWFKLGGKSVLRMGFVPEWPTERIKSPSDFRRLADRVSSLLEKHGRTHQMQKRAVSVEVLDKTNYGTVVSGNG
jgi:hypothetical protein